MPLSQEQIEEFGLTDHTLSLVNRAGETPVSNRNPRTPPRPNQATQSTLSMEMERASRSLMNRLQKVYGTPIRDVPAHQVADVEVDACNPTHQKQPAAKGPSTSQAPNDLHSKPTSKKRVFDPVNERMVLNSRRKVIPSVKGANLNIRAFKDK